MKYQLSVLLFALLTQGGAAEDAGPYSAGSRHASGSIKNSVRGRIDKSVGRRIERAGKKGGKKGGKTKKKAPARACPKDAKYHPHSDTCVCLGRNVYYDAPSRSCVPKLLGGSATLQKISDRGHLQCGIGTNAGFASRTDTGGYEGFDIDLCRAVAAATFGTAYGKVAYSDLTAAERFVRLGSSEVDMLARTTTHTMARDVLEPASGKGFTFAVPYYYDGLSFGGVSSDCIGSIGDDGCEGQTLQICVVSGTTFEVITQGIFSSSNTIVPVNNADALVEGIIDGTCDVIGGSKLQVAEIVLRDAGYKGDYFVDPDIFSKDPLAMVTREDDPKFSDFVFWIMQSLIAAEESGITKENAESFGTTPLFGSELENMFIDAIKTVGNYGDMYGRHLEAITPRTGLDNLNDGAGLLYSIPI